MAHRDKFGRPTFGRKWVRRDEADAPPALLPVTLPLGVRISGQTFVVADSAGRAVAHVEFEEDPDLRAQTRRFSQPEARDIAQMIALLLTDVESEKIGATAGTIPFEELSAENDE